jgi:hypothetical protein
MIDDIFKIVDYIPNIIKRYMIIPIYLHVLICIAATLLLSATVYFFSYNYFANKTSELQQKEIALKNQIAKYYTDLATIKKQEIVINDFIDNHIINQNQQAQLLSTINQSAAVNNIQIIALIPNPTEQQPVNIYYQQQELKFSTCNFAITINTISSNNLTNFINELIIQKHIIIINDLEIIKQNNNNLQVFFNIEIYC